MPVMVATTEKKQRLSRPRPRPPGCCDHHLQLLTVITYVCLWRGPWFLGLDQHTAPLSDALLPDAAQGSTSSSSSFLKSYTLAHCCHQGRCPHLSCCRSF